MEPIVQAIIKFWIHSSVLLIKEKVNNLDNTFFWVNWIKWSN